MHKAIRTSLEGRRGCGWRKVGGIYMVEDADVPKMSCGRIPIPTKVCPCCGRGIRQARGFTWVDADELLRASPGKCRHEGKPNCNLCIINKVIEEQLNLGRAGLVWVGEHYYPNVYDFEAEADRMGISRRLPAVPNDFVLGETYILLGHPNAVMEGIPKIGEKPEFSPGIFRIFKPQRLEIIVTGEEDDDTIEGYLERGLSPVVVERKEGVQTTMEGMNT